MGRAAAGAGREFVRAAMRAPYLERDEEHDLAVRWREAEDQAALHRLTSAHMRLVIAIAARFRNFGLPMGDLIQEGHVGLLEAAARFEPDREVRFSTYATWWIRASIQDYILRNWSIVRGGTSLGAKGAVLQPAPAPRPTRPDAASQRPRQLVYGEIAERYRGLARPMSR